MKENEALFIWMLRQLEMIYLEITSLYHSTIMITDADAALTAALSTVFSRTNHLCIRHVQKDVIADVKNEIYIKAVEKGLKWPEHVAFMNKTTIEMETDRTKILRASTIEEYEQNQTLFQTHHSG